MIVEMVNSNFFNHCKCMISLEIVFTSVYKSREALSQFTSRNRSARTIYRKLTANAYLTIPSLGAVLFSRLGPSKINWIKLDTLSACLESEVVYKQAYSLIYSFIFIHLFDIYSPLCLVLNNKERRSRNVWMFESSLRNPPSRSYQMSFSSRSPYSRSGVSLENFKKSIKRRKLIFEDDPPFIWMNVCRDSKGDNKTL